MTQPQSNDYTKALAEAAALYAVAKAAPEPLDAIAATARATVQASQLVQLTVTQKILALWKRTNPYDDRAVAAFAAAAGREMIPAQQVVARLTAAARTEQLRMSGVRVTITPRVPDNVRSAAPDGKLVRRPRSEVQYEDGNRHVTQASSNTNRVFVRVADNFRYTRSRSDQATANTAAERRIETLVDGNMQVVRSHVEFQSMQQAVDLDRPIIGYRRIIHPELSMGGVCGMCVVAADRIYKTAELKAIHLRCKCAVLEVFEDYDPGHQLNSKDLAALYEAAGGSTRKQLKRTRYKIVDHAELGPMLTPVKGSPVPYFPADVLVPA
ncbi:hypothetical protein [Nocardia sp. NPDC051463]|uniref:hypothetical protein n=1 Tax=Nocardia sp. NPDC051463 TaxID=3154845 RepID=UPI00344E8009